MTNTWKIALAGAAMIALSACASMPESIKPAASAPIAARGEATRFGTLPPQKLAAGECAMFLWARTTERKLVFFGARDGHARAIVDGREVGLTRAAIEGREFLGQFENQTYAYQGHKVQVQVGFEQRPGLARGVVIPQGTLRLTQDDGWEYILPVGGLVACEDV